MASEFSAAFSTAFGVTFGTVTNLTSRVSLLRVTLVNDIIARLATDAVTGVTVSAFQVPNMTREDHVFLGGVEAVQTDMTYSFREENFDVDGAVWIPRMGSNPVDAYNVEARALEVFASVEKALRDDSTLDGVIFDAEIASYETNIQWFDDGWVAGVVSFTINVEAHL